MRENHEQTRRVKNCPYNLSPLVRFIYKIFDIDTQPRAVGFWQDGKRYFVYSYEVATNKTSDSSTKACAAREIVQNKENFSREITICNACNHKISVSSI